MANIWRAMQMYPDELAKVCDWPVNHADLAARRLALIRREDELLAKLIDDEKYCDVELAGYWIWATSQWIGAGMLDRKKVKAPIESPELDANSMPNVAAYGSGVSAQSVASPELASVDKIPQVCGSGAGVTALGTAGGPELAEDKRPSVGHGGHGVHAQGVAEDAELSKRPALTTSGNGVHAIGVRSDALAVDGMPKVAKPGGVVATGLAVDGMPKVSKGGDGVAAMSMSLGSVPHIAGSGEGIHALGNTGRSDGPELLQIPFSTNLWTWFRALSERLRYVRVVCGDWTRICGGNWQDGQGQCGMFFDPPYGSEATRCEVYKEDSMDVAGDVREWVKARGGKESYRIVLAGYYEEHEELLKHGWRVHCWAAQGGYGNQGSEESRGKKNRLREALFFSPHCVHTGLDLF